MTLATAAPRRDGSVIGLVGLGHFLSHFYIFLLPPLFPLLKDGFGVSYVELGLLMTVFNVVSGVTQAPAGFLVDRFGPGRLLIAGVVLEATAYLGMGLIGSYGAMLVLLCFAGLANSIYHPADYAILSAAVRPERMGRAFSLHTFAGFLGNAITPAAVVLAAGLFGWEAALVTAGLIGLASALLMIVNRGLLEITPSTVAKSAERTAKGSSMALLLSFPILMSFCFFVALAMSQSGLSSFGPTAFVQMYGVGIETAGFLFTLFASGNAAGILAGGWIADRTSRHERVAILGFVATAAVMLLIAFVPLPLAVLAPLLALAGILFGLIMPSRDMLVRAAAPPDAMGRVFGFVSTGLNVGSAITPLAIGWVMDQGRPEWLFVVAAAFMAVSILTVLAVRPRRAVTSPSANPI